ncbi:hypothetical protein N0V84_004671 [Fusarium piperis]|uniref:DNA replication regulator Sld3 C-terminal domain-containing protein n=1 Tax=Fusarium piperis TaxID=1435070 RepID=A0A9W8WF75_9HYPO|nr:hypothetical protein N0V84_004671 [Fusarium piperis]
MEHLLKPSIALKPHPPNLHIQPRVLHPLMVIPRQHLPLSCIDIHASNIDLSSHRFYEAHVKILDLESRMGSVPVVLLARKESSRAVYALERQDNGLYVVFRLGSWVDLEELARDASAVCRERLRPPVKLESQGRAASSAITTPQLHKDQKMKRAAIEAIQSLVRKRPRSQSVSTMADSERHDGKSDATVPVETKLPSPVLMKEELATIPADNTQQAVSSASINPEEPPPQQTADEIFDTLRAQYFDALYKSMGSLAYFAKGPLSRARSAFHLDLESSLDMGDLIEFLKGLVLTTVQIDKKYRDTIPELIARMKTALDSSDEGRKRKRRAKKMKIGKDGLYPHEDEHLRKWWVANKPELKEDEFEVPAQQIKSLTSMLRTRETQLQMILILEILALTPLKPAEDAEDSQLPPLPGGAESQGDMAPPAAKKRNKHNLPVLVDVHADRLTIWQSTASDEQLLLEDSQVSQALDGQSQQKASSEPLKDFCVDIIVPLSLKRSSSKRDQRPGAVTKRPTPGKPTRTLQRALSTEQQSRRSVSRGPSNMIALMRSATPASLPGIKREASDSAAIKSALKAEPDLLNRRGGLLSRSSSMSNLQDAKASKKAQVEAELKDAISSLRKPNREVVGKALAEAAERRATVSLSAKKVKKPARSSLGASVVKATPANNRFRDVFASKSGTADVSLMGTDEVIPPSSMPSMIPSTGLRAGHRDAFRRSPTPDLERIGDTPTKGGSNFLRRPAKEEDVLPFPPSSPLMERRTVSAANLFAPREQKRRDSFTPSRDEGILATPVKATSRSINNVEDQNVAPAKPVSIYQQLGWDDDMDDLL